MPKKASNKKTKQYKATLIVGPRAFEGKGETIHEAIASIEPGNINAKTILVVEEGKNSKEKVLPIPLSRRAYNMLGLNRQVALEQLAGMFDGV